MLLFGRGFFCFFLSLGTTRLCFRPTGPLSFFRPTGPLSCFRPTGPLSCFRPTGPLSCFRPTCPLSCFRPTGPLSCFRPTGPLSCFRPTGSVLLQTHWVCCFRPTGPLSCFRPTGPLSHQKAVQCDMFVSTFHLRTLPTLTLPAYRSAVLKACVFVTRDTVRHPRRFVFGTFVRKPNCS